MEGNSDLAILLSTPHYSLFPLGSPRQGWESGARRALEEFLYGTLLRLNTQKAARRYSPGVEAPDLQRGPCGLGEDEPRALNWRLRPEIKLQHLNELAQMRGGAEPPPPGANWR